MAQKARDRYPVVTPVPSDRIYPLKGQNCDWCFQDTRHPYATYCCAECLGQARVLIQITTRSKDINYEFLLTRDQAVKDPK